MENPPGCVVMLCFVADTLVPDPTTPGVIPPGFNGTAQVVNADTLDPVGAVQFTWQATLPDTLAWYRGPDDQIVFHVVNNSVEPAGLLLNLGEGAWDIDPECMTGAQLGLRSSETWGMGEIGCLKTMDATFSETGSFALPHVDPIPVGPPFNVDWPIDSFFDVYYAIEISPQSAVDFEGI